MMTTPTFNSTSTSTACSNNGYFVETDIPYYSWFDQREYLNYSWFDQREYLRMQREYKRAVNKAYFNSLLFDMSFEYKFSVKEVELNDSILFRKQFMQPKCFRNLRF